MNWEHWYWYRIDSYARYLVMTHTPEQIKEAIESRRKTNGEQEAKDIRKVAANHWKSGRIRRAA